jgi:predicted nucleic acid-binding protein
MRVLFDTSLLVAAMVEGHPAHSLALPWLQRTKARLDTGLIAAHTLAELYAILTRLPINPRISPALALQLIRSNILDTCTVVALSYTDYVSLLSHLAGLGIAGGAVYDALLLHAAWIAGVDRVVTLNAHDFRRVYPALADKIISPLEGLPS